MMRRVRISARATCQSFAKCRNVEMSDIVFLLSFSDRFLPIHIDYRAL
jgi:hypothetical protein